VYFVERFERRDR
jgi:quercetin dioxygenase-like cupin family protein